MEGTSGAAECALLRGKAYEAALEGRLRLSPAFFAKEADRGARKCVEGGRRKRRSVKQAVERSLARFRVSVAWLGDPVDDPHSRAHLRRRLFQPPAEAGLRQEVPEPIGLGLSSYRERSRRGEVDVGQPQRPLAREISAG
jgi:hypothetical protein